MPTLTHLSIDESWHALRPGVKPPPPQNPIVTTTFLEHFIVNPGDKRSRDFLPRLTDLTLTVFPLEPSDQQALERTLASRVTTLRALVLTVLVSNEVECKSDYDSITCFRAAGTRVHCSFQVTSV
ncbi:hypothetical protein E1B28_007072 [Marasmius oreades]|uniref:Uncharacterized protein n=1 Tax=Marasmius oreades TaxID=181124 RepID=A0A9P7UUJ5_9AGAR|nr:uncharacterized protein E1B28_007072 [Marasmius oreades]KAG7093391.1 hypothetical protein E1B28_007072 [Marasmius oreades]